MASLQIVPSEIVAVTSVIGVNISNFSPPYADGSNAYFRSSTVVTFTANRTSLTDAEGDGCQQYNVSTAADAINGTNCSWFTDGDDFDVGDYLEKHLGRRYRELGEMVALIIVYSVIFLTGVVGNVSTCLVIIRNKRMHTATNYYLFSLAVSDLLTLILGLPPELYTILEAYPWRFGQPYCLFKTFLTEMTSSASILTIAAFTIERYLAICHSLRAQTTSGLSRAVRCVIVVWVVACLTAVVYPIHTRTFYYVADPRSSTGEKLEDSLICTIPSEWMPNMRYAFQVSTFLLFVLPMILITVLYVRIGIALRRSTIATSSHVVHQSARTTPGGTAVNNNVTGSGGSTRQMLRHGPNQRHQLSRVTPSRVAQSRKSIFKMLIAVVVAFFVCWAPFHAQRLMTVYIRDDQWTPAWLEVQSHLFYISGPWLVDGFIVIRTIMAMWTDKAAWEIVATAERWLITSGVLYFVSATVNPILYNVMSRNYRQSFQMTLCYWCIDDEARQRLRRSGFGTSTAYFSAAGQFGHDASAGTGATCSLIPSSSARSSRISPALSRTKSNFSTSVNEKSPTRPTATIYSVDDGAFVELGGGGVFAGNCGAATTNGFVACNSSASDSADNDLLLPQRQPQPSVKVTLDLADVEPTIDAACDGQAELEKRSNLTCNVTPTSSRTSLANKTEQNPVYDSTPQVTINEPSTVRRSASDSYGLDVSISRRVDDGHLENSSPAAAVAVPAEPFGRVMSPAFQPLPTKTTSDASRRFGFSQNAGVGTTAASASNNCNLSLPPTYDVVCR